jgi:hypothetical protein
MTFLQIKGSSLHNYTWKLKPSNGINRLQTSIGHTDTHARNSRKVYLIRITTLETMTISSFNQICKLKQTESIMEHTTQHQNLPTQVDDLSEDRLQELYIRGLKEDICYEVKCSNPALPRMQFTRKDMYQDKVRRG